MVIVEEGSNFPSVLGAKNIPPEREWGAGQQVGNLASMIGTVTDRSFLPQFFKRRFLFGQLPPRGTGLLTGAAGARRGGLPRGPLQRLMRHKGIYGQDMSVHTDYDTQVHNIVSAQTEKNIPLPWGPRTWAPGALIATLPSMIETGTGISGPTRSMHPDLSVEM